MAGNRPSHLGESFVAARFVIAVAVNAKKSPLRTISMGDLQKVFAVNLMTGPATWKDVSGSGSDAKIEIYHPQSFSPEWCYFQKKVLLGGPYVDDVDFSVRDRHQKRSDAEIIAAIAKQENTIGFFRYRLDKKIDKRIRILGIANDNKDKSPVFPTPSALADGTYPLADTLTLHLHRDAPPEARDFCKFAIGPEAAKIFKQYGLWPEYELDEVRGQKRLADVKSGKGTEIAVCDLSGGKGMLKDLAAEFVKAKAAVQLKFVRGDGKAALTPAISQTEKGMAAEAVEKFNNGEIELLLLDRPLTARGQGTADKDKGSTKSPTPKSVELGRMAVGVIVHPDNPMTSLPLDKARAIFCGEPEMAGSPRRGCHHARLRTETCRSDRAVAQGKAAGKRRKEAAEICRPA